MTHDIQAIFGTDQAQSLDSQEEGRPPPLEFSQGGHAPEPAAGSESPRGEQVRSGRRPHHRKLTVHKLGSCKAQADALLFRPSIPRTRRQVQAGGERRGFQQAFVCLLHKYCSEGRMSRLHFV